MDLLEQIEARIAKHNALIDSLFTTIATFTKEDGSATWTLEHRVFNETQGKSWVLFAINNFDGCEIAGCRKILKRLSKERKEFFGIKN